MAEDEWFSDVLQLRDYLIGVATGGSKETVDYMAVRKRLQSDREVSRRLPDFLRSSYTAADFWSFIKMKFPSYQERRDYLRQEFSAVLEYLSEKGASPADESISELFRNVDRKSVADVWSRALDRRETDSEGAITLARTLLETVCKFVLDEEAVEYEDGIELPKLYGLVAKVLNLAPSAHSEEIFKRILGGCTSVVEGLGSLRNKLGDAHGKGKRIIKPAARHAELAVNLAGSMATFIISTFEVKSKASAR